MGRGGQGHEGGGRRFQMNPFTPFARSMPTGKAPFGCHPRAVRSSWVSKMSHDLALERRSQVVARTHGRNRGAVLGAPPPGPVRRQRDPSPRRSSLASLPTLTLPDVPLRLASLPVRLVSRLARTRAEHGFHFAASRPDAVAAVAAVGSPGRLRCRARRRTDRPRRAHPRGRRDSPSAV
jgi:hypothetical protein